MLNQILYDKTQDCGKTSYYLPGLFTPSLGRGLPYSHTHLDGIDSLAFELK